MKRFVSANDTFTMEDAITNPAQPAPVTVSVPNNKQRK